MRITASFQAEENIKLPPSYNHLVQSLIYRHIDEKLANFLHKHGFLHGKRAFKLFTFSRIQGKVKYLLQDHSFEFTPPLSLIISSPIDGFIESLAENFVKSEAIKINAQKLYLESINVHFAPKINSENEIKMLSPVTIYSTLSTVNGKKKTYYYSPFEKEFSQLLEENLKKKYEALYHREINNLCFSIKPLRVNNSSEKIVSYKGTVIKGWVGVYKAKGSPELIKLAYDAGLGAKNSQGFGCFKVISSLEEKDMILCHRVRL